MMAGLAPLIWHYFGGSAFVVAALAFAYFSPVFKKTALWVALGGVVFMFAYTLGVKDEKNHWTVREERTVDTAVKAREDAVNSVEHSGDGAGGVRDNSGCRDCQ